MMYPFLGTASSSFNPCNMQQSLMNFTMTGVPSDTTSFQSNNSAASQDKQMVEGSIVIRPEDVLCGRGKLSFNHSGNRRFRHVVSQAMDEYKAASSKWEKSLVAAKLVAMIQNSGGRFLKQRKNNDDQWYELSPSECKSKASHAIRDAIAATKQSGGMSNSSISSSSSRRPSMVDISASSLDDSSQSQQPQTKSAAVKPSLTISGFPGSLAGGLQRTGSNGFRGTWSSNSLVSLTDGDNEMNHERRRPSQEEADDENCGMDDSCSTANTNYSESSASSNGDDGFQDDFVNYIHQVLGPNHK